MSFDHKWSLKRASRATIVGSIGFLFLIGKLGAANTLTYTYDALGRLTFVNDPTNGNRDYDYDKAGNRLLVSVGTANDAAAEPGGGGGSPTYVQITSNTGGVIPAAASLYTVVSSCYGVPQVCNWTVRKLYGDHSAVIAVVHAPNGTNPACNSGVTQQITAGYARSVCVFSALSTVYGQ